MISIMRFRGKKEIRTIKVKQLENSGNQIGKARDYEVDDALPEKKLPE